MGMGFFTINLQHWNISFSLYAMLFCVIGRILNIFPLSCIANICRGKKQHQQKSNRITWKMQFVLCFAGLRGAIAFALALNMPGPNAETYTTVTLTICGITTVICGGFTERILGLFDMKEIDESDKIDAEADQNDSMELELEVDGEDGQENNDNEETLSDAHRRMVTC